MKLPLARPLRPSGAHPHQPRRNSPSNMWRPGFRELGVSGPAISRFEEAEFGRVLGFTAAGEQCVGVCSQFLHASLSQG